MEAKNELREDEHFQPRWVCRISAGYMCAQPRRFDFKIDRPVEEAWLWTRSGQTLSVKGEL